MLRLIKNLNEFTLHPFLLQGSSNCRQAIDEPITKIFEPSGTPVCAASTETLISTITIAFTKTLRTKLYYPFPSLL